LLGEHWLCLSIFTWGKPSDSRARPRERTRNKGTENEPVETKVREVRAKRARGSGGFPQEKTLKRRNISVEDPE
jgi:hypothetical protein